MKFQVAVVKGNCKCHNFHCVHKGHHIPRGCIRWTEASKKQKKWHCLTPGCLSQETAANMTATYPTLRDMPGMETLPEERKRAVEALIEAVEQGNQLDAESLQLLEPPPAAAAPPKKKARVAKEDEVVAIPTQPSKMDATMQEPAPVAAAATEAEAEAEIAAEAAAEAEADAADAAAAENEPIPLPTSEEGGVRKVASKPVAPESKPKMKVDAAPGTEEAPIVAPPK